MPKVATTKAPKAATPKPVMEFKAYGIAQARQTTNYKKTMALAKAHAATDPDYASTLASAKAHTIKCTTTASACERCHEKGQGKSFRCFVPVDEEGEPAGPCLNCLDEECSLDPGAAE